jgi:phage shock protein E
MHAGIINSAAALIAAAAVIAFVLLKRASQISSQRARACLNNGALVIDVRSRAEFNSGHLAGALNLPLDELESALPRRVQDKNHVLLLHCHTGMRSGLAKHRLKAMGYANAFNLGSYRRAASIVQGK